MIIIIILLYIPCRLRKSENFIEYHLHYNCYYLFFFFLCFPSLICIGYLLRSLFARLYAVDEGSVMTLVTQWLSIITNLRQEMNVYNPKWTQSSSSSSRSTLILKVLLQFHFFSQFYFFFIFIFIFFSGISDSACAFFLREDYMR